MEPADVYMRQHPERPDLKRAGGHQKERPNKRLKIDLPQCLSQLDSIAVMGQAQFSKQMSTINSLFKTLQTAFQEGNSRSQIQGNIKKIEAIERRVQDDPTIGDASRNETLGTIKELLFLFKIANIETFLAPGATFAIIGNEAKGFQIQYACSDVFWRSDAIQALTDQIKTPNNHQYETSETRDGLFLFTLSSQLSAEVLGYSSYGPLCMQTLAQIQRGGKATFTPIDQSMPKKTEGPVVHKLLRTSNCEQHYKDLWIACGNGKDSAPYVKDFNMLAVKKGNVPLDLTQPKYDIYDRHFQDFALAITNGASNKQRKQMENHSELAIVILMRARNMAIATRSDVDWNGKLLTSMGDEHLKATELKMHWDSLKTYKLGGGSSTKKEVPGPYQTQISVLQADTESATIKMLQRPGCTSENTAFLNMANSYTLGGGHQGGRGSQEEGVCSACDVIATLGMHAKFGRDGRALYEDDFRIPRGGSHCSTTRFINSDVKIECKCISHAFADFRPKSQNGSGEYDDFKKHPTNKDAKNEPLLDPTDRHYQERIKIDIRGVLRTAKAEGIINLVLGGTGCGAFRHHGPTEAQAWIEVLGEPEFQGWFDQIIFAIIDNTRPTYSDFEKAFANRPAHAPGFVAVDKAIAAGAPYKGNFIQRPPGDETAAYRVAIYEETRRACEHGYINSKGELVKIENRVPTVTYQKISYLGVPTNTYSTKFGCLLEDTVTAAVQLKAAGKNPGVLNMANDKGPGGGIKKGARAQEENIGRRSALLPALETQKYPYGEFNTIYTPDVPVFRDKEYKFMDEPVRISFVASAVYDFQLHPRSDRAMFGFVDADGDIANMTAAQFKKRLIETGKWEEYKTKTEAKLEQQLRTFAVTGHIDLLLSAMGCGAFRNPPQIIAQLLESILLRPEFHGRFESIQFGIIKMNPKDQANIDVFQDMCQRMNQLQGIDPKKMEAIRKTAPGASLQLVDSTQTKNKQLQYSFLTKEERAETLTKLKAIGIECKERWQISEPSNEGPFLLTLRAVEFDRLK